MVGSHVERDVCRGGDNMDIIWQDYFSGASGSRSITYFPLATLMILYDGSVSLWCKVCGIPTEHRVSSVFSS